MKILYFTQDFSSENVKFAKENGLTLRNLGAYHATDFVEQCDAVCGDIPERYQDLPKYTLPESSSQEKPLDKMTVPELTTALKALNVEIPQGAKKDELLALLKQAEGGDNDPERTNG